MLNVAPRGTINDGKWLRVKELARNKGNHDIASQVRGAFIRACASLDQKWSRKLENGNTALSAILEQMLQEKPLDALNAVSKFVPKEMLVETTVIQQIDQLSDEALDAELARLRSESGGVPAAGGENIKTKH